MGTIRVLLGDDQEIIRQGLATILKYAPDIEVVGQAGDGREALTLAHRLCPDVVLMDLKMPRQGGIPTTKKISAQLPNSRVIILTTYDADDMVFEGIRAGAQGYLLKDASSEKLVESIRGVMRDESQLDPRIAHKVLNEFQRLTVNIPRTFKGRSAGEELVLERLTPRENDVLHLLVEGMSNKEIAAALSLTEGTVKNHVSAIIAKLQANDRTHAVVRALRRGLVEL